METMIIEERDNVSRGQMAIVKTIRVDAITVNPGRRPVNQDKVKKLAESIKTTALINPINITANDILIAGVHRLEAVKLLGWEEIEARVLDITGLRAELAEIDENFMRQELSPIEIGELANRRDEILEELGLRAKSGDNQFTAGEDNSPPLKTTADIAEEMGLTERVLQQNKQLSKKLTQEAKEAVVNHKIPKDQALALCREDPETQNKIVGMINAGSEKNIKDMLRRQKKEEADAKKKILTWRERDELLKEIQNEYSCIIVHDSEKMRQFDYYNRTDAKDDSVLFFWTTNESIFESRDFFYTFGYNYRRIIVWIKTSGSCEFCLVGTKGKYKDSDLSDLAEYFWEDTETKKGNKPEVFYKIVNDLCKNEKKLEYFPNEKREGYDIYEEPVLNIIIPDGYTHIHDSLFTGYEITGVTIPESVISIGDSTFAHNRLKNVVMPNGVITIGEHAFNDNKLTEVVIPDSVTSIKDGAFENNQLTSVIISNNVTYIGRFAFRNNQLTSVVIPNSVTEIQSQAFGGNKLTSVIIPDSVTIIYENSFDMENLDEKSKQSIQTALERTKRFFNEKEYGKKIQLVSFTEGFNKEEGQKLLETTGLSYMTIERIFYFDLLGISLMKPEESGKAVEWLDKNEEFLDRENCSYGYFTKDGYIEEDKFNKMKPKPRKLTVAEYRKLLEQPSA